MRNLKRNVL